MTTTTSSAATNAFLRALAHSKSVDKQARLLEEMMCSFSSSTKGVKVDDEDQALFLDLRPREKYRCHSLLHSVNIPFSEISGSFHLLPPREVPFAVLLDEEEKEETKDEVPSLFNKQREVLQRGDFKGCQWNIKYAFVYNEHFVKAVLKIQKDSLGNGVDTILALIDDEKVEEKKKKKTHTKRLWEPSPSVVELYKTHLSSETNSAGGGGGGTSSSTNNNNNNIVLDLGSGVGRDSIYLASKGFTVFACDFDQKALLRTQEMAKLYGVEDKVNALKWDARDDDAFLRALSVVGDVSRLKLVLGVRFCHKPLFAQIVKHLPGKSDCLFAWFHFAKGCELSKVGRPNKEKDLIVPNEELRSIFSREEGFEVLKDDVSFLLDGRPSANFIARKRKDDQMCM